MMRIAFLILAHHQPAMLLRLIGRLDSAEAWFFIHVDAKTDIRAFVERTASYPNVVYVPAAARRNIAWGGMNSVDATMTLMTLALQHHDFDRLCLLSGADYPIKSLAHIHREFASSAQYVQIQRKLVSGGPSPFDRRANRYFLGNIPMLNPRSAPDFVLRLVRFSEHRTKRKFPAGFELFYGSNWWCITAAAATAVLAFFDERPALLKWCRWTANPDEIFLQTALKATRFADDIAYDYSAPPRLGSGLAYDDAFESLHYLDWKNANPTTPKRLGLEDLPPLLASQAMFARKFDPLRSQLLLDALDCAG